MTDRAGFCEGCGMPVCCDQLRAVIDAARAHVNDPDIELPADWNIPHTPTFAALDAAVRALDGGYQ